MGSLPSDVDYAAPNPCMRTHLLDLQMDPQTAQRKALPALAKRLCTKDPSQTASSSSSLPRPPEVIPPVLARPARGYGGRGKRGLKRTISDYEAIDRINRMRIDRGKELGDP